eukprot:TRINITY_DN656_c0_g1_i3.p1 TRINITY_DN656_c0_g1~~TRINITY_DN656_c0_g1_i3.p1  ORF type:complete len:938 (-),score=207.67 TRINITY_DN656_c0_g1_i3:479-3292(-)
MLKLFANYGRDLRVVGPNGQKPIHISVQTNDVATLTYLLTLYTDVQAVEGNLYTLLHRCAFYGSADCATLLVRSGVPVDVISPNNGSTPLTRALINGHLNTAKTLIALGANVNLKDDGGRTPAIWMAGSNRLKEMQFLHDSGANLSISDDNGFSPLHYAAKEGHNDMVSLLLRLHANALALNLQKTMPIHWAIFRDSVPTVESLLSNQRDARLMIKARDSDGSTPFIWAAERGSISMMKLLMQHGAAIEESDAKGMTAFMLVCANGFPEACRFLIQSGTKIEAKDNEGWMAIHHAALNGHGDVIDTLLQSGLSSALTGKFGMTALHCAASKGKLACLELLTQKGAAALRMLDEQMRSCLHWASIEGASEVVDFLLANGLAIDAKDHMMRTPLILALAYGHENVAQILINRGADIHAIDQFGMSALHHAAHSNLVTVARQLIKSGISVNIKTNAPSRNLSVGSTPLHAAIVATARDMAVFLVKLGTRLDAQDSTKTTPLQLAVKRGEGEFLAYLFTYCAMILSKSKSTSSSKGSTQNQHNTTGTSALVTSPSTADSANEGHFHHKQFQVTIPIFNNDKLGGSWTLIMNLGKVKVRKSGKTMHKVSWAECPELKPDAVEATRFTLQLSAKGPLLSLSCSAIETCKVIAAIVNSMVAMQQQDASVNRDMDSMPPPAARVTAPSISSSSDDPSSVDTGGSIVDDSHFFMDEFVCYLDGNRARERKLMVIDGCRLKLKKGIKTHNKAHLSAVRFEPDPSHPKRFVLTINQDRYALEARTADECMIIKRLLVDFAPSKPLANQPESGSLSSTFTKTQHKRHKATVAPPAVPKIRSAYEDHDDLGYTRSNRVRQMFVDQSDVPPTPSSISTRLPTPTSRYSASLSVPPTPSRSVGVPDLDNARAPVDVVHLEDEIIAPSKCALDRMDTETNYRIIQEFRFRSAS